MNNLKCFIFFGIFLLSNITLASNFDTLKNKAENGDSSSQYMIGLHYLTGNEVEENPVEGRRWIKLAAENGDLGAQLRYGKNLPDYVEGLKWIEKSAKGGELEAQVFLGELNRTYNNDYVEYDIEKSIFWLKKASNNDEHGKYDGPFRLFLMFENGDGVEKDAKLASHWLNEAQKKTFLGAEDLYYYGIQFRTFNDGFKYIRLSAEMGYPEAQSELGDIYSMGYEAFNSPKIGRIIVKKDGKKAIKWLRLAARKGFTDAYYQLGFIYELGIFKDGAKEGDLWDIPKNKIEAVKYYRWAARAGHLKAKEKLNRQNTFESDSWNKYDTAKSLYINNDLEYTWHKAIISFSENGDKRLYFSIGERSNICQPESNEGDVWRSVWEINNQAISMIIFCGKRSSGFYGISATPRTEQGDEFVINTFLKTVGNVSIEGSGYTFPISANGFTNAWSNKSNKAL